jgi:trehalose synthase-fused probable maltokinase
MAERRKRAAAPPARGRKPRAPADLVTALAALLPDRLATMRWFAGKGRTIARVSPLDAAQVPGSEGFLALFEVGYADGGAEVYQIPVAPDSAGAPADALDDPRFTRALLTALRDGIRLDGARGVFRCVPTAAGAALASPAPTTAIRPAGEQSNSSLVYGDRAVLKLFRKPEPGLNPDDEIPRFLTEATGFGGVPRLLGGIQYEAAGLCTSLAILQEYVANDGDVWTLIQRRLEEYFAAAAGDGTEPDPAFARTLAAADAKEADRLGRLTGQLHAALASAPAGSPLAPEPIVPEDLAGWQSEMAAHLEQTLRAAEAVLERLPPGARQSVQDLVADAAHLREGLAGLHQLLAAAPVMKIRIHGDYHLGQVLKTGDGFQILDFEGEPARPLAQRRAKQCALKDVAGMLRSYAYAVEAALRSATTLPADLGRLAPWADAWETAVRSAFLDGYLAETWDAGATFLPRERAALEAVLQVYELDKAIYELRYEVAQRPDWIAIPLAALRRPALHHLRTAPAQLRTREGPFNFVACLELVEFVGLRAENERQLMELLEEVPLDSIYYHTHSFFLRHKFLAGAYPNDFANWAAVQVRDRTLGERLAMVDPGAFADLAALRDELVAVIDDHLRALPMVPGALFGEPFEFLQSRLVEIPTGRTASTLQEFRDVMLQIDLTAIYYHLMEARMRLGRGQNDFAAWVERGLGLPTLAIQVRAVDPYAHGLERTRARLVQLCDAALADGAD